MVSNVDVCGREQVVNLERLLSPRSVAVVGASQKAGRVNGAIRNLQELGFGGEVYAVNPKYATVMGVPCYPSLSAISQPVDLVVVGIPSHAVLGVLEEAHGCGIPAAVIISSGFREAGGEGESLQSALAAFIERSGMLVCGPNCVGAVNLHARAAGYYSVSPKDCVPGDLAVVSQSGTVIVALVRGERPAAFSYLVSSGNEVGVSSAEYIRHFVADPETRIIGTFLEGINRPREFLKAAEAARQANKPIIAITTGRSELGRAASAAHTGSLAGSYEVQRTALHQVGVVQCDDIDEWIEAVELFRHGRPPKGAGIGVVGVSGGENALVVDHLNDCGLSVPVLSPVGARALAAVLPSYVRPSNPVDTSGGLGDDPSIYQRCIEALAAEPAIDIIIVSQDSPAYFDRLAAEALTAVSATSDKSFVFLNNIARPATPDVQSLLRQARIPYLQGMRPAAKAIRAFIDYHLKPPQAAAEPAIDSSRGNRARAILRKQGRLVTEDVAKALLALYGVPVVAERVVATAEEAAAAAEALGFPVAAKVLSPDIAHKARIGGVRLGLGSGNEVLEAVRGMEAAVRIQAPEARLAGFALQAMLPTGLELILGIKRDERFGQTILLGLGGTLVEAVRAFSMRLAPVSQQAALDMVDEVPHLVALAEKAAPNIDIRNLVAPLITSLSSLCAELDQDLEALDINPLILDVHNGRLVAVDALMVRRDMSDTAAAATRN